MSEHRSPDSRLATRHSLAFALLLFATTASATTLTFDQVLARAESAQAVPPAAIAAADALATPQGRGLPTIRLEASATSADTVDVFARNVLRFDGFTTIVSVDYPLLDGGVRANRQRVARLDAATFRQRMRETADYVFRETLDAVTRLYTAQERLRILNAGLRRAVEMRERAKAMLDTHEISNVTAARWSDEAIAAESQLLDLELQRLEAETHIKQLMGSTSDEPIEIAIVLDDPAVRALSLAVDPQPLVDRDEGVARANLLFERRRLALAEAEAARKPQVGVSAFGGFAALGDLSPDLGDSRNYGLYGMRLTITLPMFDAAGARRVAEARMEAEQANLERMTTTSIIKRQMSTLWLSVASLEKRIALLEQSVEVARRREESIVRLAAAGVRSEAEVADAAFDRTRRESELLGLKVEMWKHRQLLHRRTTAPPPVWSAGFQPAGPPASSRPTVVAR